MADEHTTGAIDGDVSDQEATQEAISRSQLLDQFDTAAKEQKEFNAQRMAALRAAQERSRPDYADAERRIADIERIPKPRFERPPAPPSSQEMLKPTTLQRTFGMASIFALMSIGLAKGSGIYALKGFGGFMEGMHQGNIENAKAALEDFNNNMDVVKQSNDIAQKEYSNIFGSKKYSLEQKERLFHMKALELGDEMAIQNQAQGGMTAVHSYLKDKAVISHQWALEALRYKQIEAQLGRASGKSATDNILGIPVGEIPQAAPGQKNEAFLRMLPPAQQEIVKRMAEGKLMPGLSGFGAALRGQYTQAATIYDPGFSAQTAGVIDKTRKELTPGGKVGANVVAIDTVAHHIDQWGEAFAKLNNSQIQKWNATKNKLSTEFGDPALRNVQVPAKLVAAETARILRGGNASPTEQEIMEWEKVLDTANSPAQTKGVQWELIKGVGGRISSLEQAIKTSLQDPNYKLLTPGVEGLFLKYKPKDAPVPEWLKKYAPNNPANVSDLEKKAALTPDDKKQIDAGIARKAEAAGLPKVYPKARNPQTGEVLIFKDGKWQSQ